jgi:hypothetical protein
MKTIEIPADIVRQVCNAMASALPHLDHKASQAKLRIWEGTLRDFLPETLDAEIEAEQKEAEAASQDA